jgi:hypothetical protein
MAWTAPRTYVASELISSTIFNTDVRDNLRELWHQVYYEERTSSVTLGTGDTTIITGASQTYTAEPILVQFVSPRVRSATNGERIELSLYDTTGTNLGVLAVVHPSAASIGSQSVHAARKLTPTAAAHTYMIRGLSTSGTGTVHENTGVTGTLLASYLQIWQKGGV